MRLHPTHVRLVVCAILAALSSDLHAQQLSCVQVHTLAKMARAKSMREMKPLKASAGESYLAQLVFAFRNFELQPSENTASAVLDFLPRDDSHREEWYSLSGWMCAEEQKREAISLAKLQARMSTDFARSVILVPTRMNQYISYPVIMGLDPHDDYAEAMIGVCRKRHSEFAAAIDQLPEKDRACFLRVVFEPSNCRALAHPRTDSCGAVREANQSPELLPRQAKESQCDLELSPFRF